MMGSFVEAQDEERGKVAITIISRPFCLLFQLREVVWGWVRWVSGWVTFLGMLDMVCGRLWCEGPLLAESALPYIRENLKHFLDSNPDACLHALMENSRLYRNPHYRKILLHSLHRATHSETALKYATQTIPPSYPFFPHCTFFHPCIK